MNGTLNISISAVIPTKNRPHDLVKAVDSILKQDRVPDELVIIDQTLGDESKKAVQVQFELTQTTIRLVYVHDPKVSGLVEAKERAVTESCGEIVSFLEDDVVLFPDYFHQLERTFCENSFVLGCGGVAVTVKEYSELYRILFKIFHRGIFNDPRLDLHGRGCGTGSHALVNSRYISGGISSYRREVFDRVPFDTVNGFFALEDIEFSTRSVAAFGVEHFYVNTAVRLEHYASSLNRARLGARWQRKLREYILFYKKNKETPGAHLDLVFLLAGLGLESLYAALRSVHHGPLVGAVTGLLEGVRYKLKPLV